jgi:hypothetical protein
VGVADGSGVGEGLFEAEGVPAQELRKRDKSMIKKRILINK